MRTIKQDKTLHGSHPLAELLGQISGSNAGSNSLVEIAGRICWSNRSVKFLDQIPGSNLLVKFAGQMQPILGPTLVSLGECMGAPTDSPKTGKDGRETGKEKPHAVKRGACLDWR